MVGEKVEDFTLIDQEGKEFYLYDELQESKVLLVFYPKDNSPVCTRQLTDYSTNFELFEKHNIKVYGINPESKTSHKNFCNAIDLRLKLLIDKKNEISKKLDAFGIFGTTKRKIVLIGREGIILYERTVLSVRYLSAEKIINELKKRDIIQKS